LDPFANNRGNYNVAVVGGAVLVSQYLFKKQPTRNFQLAVEFGWWMWGVHITNEQII